jgi:hypothetical protein
MKLLGNSETLQPETAVPLILITSGRNIDGIKRLLESIAMQTYVDYDVVVATESNAELIKSEIYLFTKNRGLLGLYLAPHVFTEHS